MCFLKAEQTARRQKAPDEARADLPKSTAHLALALTLHKDARALQ